MFCPITFWGLFYGFKPPYDPTCIFVRVRSTRYPQHLYHLSGKKKKKFQMFWSCRAPQTLWIFNFELTGAFNFKKIQQICCWFHCGLTWAQLPPVFKGVGGHLYHKIHEGSQKWQRRWRNPWAPEKCCPVISHLQHFQVLRLELSQQIPECRRLYKFWWKEKKGYWENVKCPNPVLC